MTLENVHMTLAYRRIPAVLRMGDDNVIDDIASFIESHQFITLDSMTSMGYGGSIAMSRENKRVRITRHKCQS